MRKLVILMMASGALIALAVTANAATAIGSLNLGVAAKNLSPIETVGCRTAGPVCRFGRTWVCRPLRGCWCARCWR